MSIVHMAVQDVAPREENTAIVALMLGWSFAVIMGVSRQTRPRLVHSRAAVAGEHD